MKTHIYTKKNNTTILSNYNCFQRLLSFETLEFESDYSFFRQQLLGLIRYMPILLLSSLLSFNFFNIAKSQTLLKSSTTSCLSLLSPLILKWQVKLHLTAF